MANRIIAYVPTAQEPQLSDQQFLQLLGLMTPALNVIAGETVFWEKRDGEWLALASHRPRARLDGLKPDYSTSWRTV